MLSTAEVFILPLSGLHSAIAMLKLRWPTVLVACHLLGPARVSLLWRVALWRVLRVVGLALALRRVLGVLGVVLRGALLLLLRWGTSLHGPEFHHWQQMPCVSFAPCGRRPESKESAFVYCTQNGGLLACLTHAPKGAAMASPPEQSCPFPRDGYLKRA